MANPWELTRAEYTDLADALYGREAAKDAWMDWPDIALKAIKDRRIIPQAVLADEEMLLILRIAAAKQMVTVADLEHIKNLAEKAIKTLRAQNPVSPTTIGFMISNLISTIFSMLMVMKPNPVEKIRRPRQR